MALLWAIFYEYKETVFVSGRVINNELSFYLKSPIDAKITDINARVNQKISQNDVLLSFDCDSLNLERDKQVKSLDYLKKSKEFQSQSFNFKLDNSDIALESLREYIEAYTTLGENGAVSKLQVNDYKRALQEKLIERQNLIIENNEKQLSLDTRIVTTENDLQELESSLNHCEFKSPVKGILADLLVKPQELVQKNQPLFKVYNPSQSNLSFSITDRDLVNVEVGQIFEVRVSSYPHRDYGSLQAKVESISPSTSGLISKQFNSEIESKVIGDQNMSTESFLLQASILQNLTPKINGDQPVLRDGMSVTALFKSGNRKLIYVVSDQLVKIQNSISRMQSRY